MKEKLNILLVDDDKFMLEYVGSLINKELYNVTTCIDSVLALELIEENKPDVIISDIIMPSVSGMELLRRVKVMDRGLPVIFITAYANLDMALDAIEAGATDFIKKPVKADILERALTKAVKSIPAVN